MLQPAPLFAPTPKAARRVLEFFTAQINNDHTRRAYLNASRRFAAWCDARGKWDTWRWDNSGPRQGRGDDADRFAD